MAGCRQHGVPRLDLALFAGLVFIVLAGVMLAPVIHTVLHRFHLEGGGQPPESQ